MKFGRRMQEEMLEHWAEYYVNYKRLKQLIEKSSLKGEKFNEELFKMIREEMMRAEQHFRGLLEELSVSHDMLMSQEKSAGPNPHGQRQMTSFPKRSRKLLSPQDTSAGGSPAVGPAADGSGFSPVSEQNSFTEMHLEVDYDDERNMSCIKRFFLRLIGDWRRRAKENDRASRMKYVEWYASAHRLEHFGELNLEAIRKALKKLNKHRSDEGDFSSAIEAEILMSPLTTLMPRLLVMMDHITSDFQRKFGEPLDQFRDINIVAQETWHAKWHWVALSFALFGIVMGSPVPLFENNPPAHKCFALFVLVISMWITEAIPFFCTAMMIPLIAVPLGILQDPVTGGVANPVVSSRIMLSHIFDHVQILVLGGLTIAKGLAKVNLEVVAASWLHRYTAHRPSLYLLGVMVFSCLLCSFVSNVAAPLLVLGVIQSTLWEFPSDTNAPKAILLGLAMACNLGGMLSPISSPQNAVALQVLSFHSIGFSTWVTIALPLVFSVLILIWLAILWLWKPFEHVSYIPLQVNNGNRPKASVGDTYLVVIVSLITIILWCLPPNLFFGDTGIIALIPIVVFFGVGVLKKEDFNTLSWHLMFLLAGGNMLGACAHDSKMIDLVASSMKSLVLNEPPYVTVVGVILVVGVVTTFVSHTVAAMIMLPIISKIGYMLPPAAVGSSLWSASPQSLVFLSVLMCSGAMAFPISSFPNVNSLLAEDECGQPYLKARDFLAIGIFATGAMVLSLVTWMIPFTNIMVN